MTVRPGFHSAVIAALVMSAAIVPAPPAADAAPGLPLASGTTELTMTVKGTPEEVFDAMTGEISGWWDHGFAEKPKSRFIEAKPGGGFYEWFDGQGNGVLHARVIYADRGKLLRMSGPFGFSGHASETVVSWKYEAAGESTRVLVTANYAGQMEPAWDAAIERVWRHFVVDRFKPWYEKGEHRKRPAPSKR